MLALLALGIVVWSFFDVGRRVIAQKRAEHERPITLTILHWGDKAEDVIVRDLAARYMRDHPTVRIVRINAGDAGTMRSKLKTMMAAGTPPDLFYLPPDILPELAQMKLIRPIDSFVQKEIAAGNKAWFDDFYPILIDAYRYDVKSERSGVGPLYALPKDFTTAVFYVNLDLFAAAGVNVPYDGWTWDEFEADMKKINALNGQSGYEGRRIFGGMIDIWPDTLRNIIWTYGGEFFGQNFRDVRLSEPPAQEAMQMIVRTRLVDQTVFNSTGIAREGGQEFINGNIGCLGPVGRWKVPRFLSDVSFHWDVVPIPYKEKKLQASQIYTVGWTMSAQTSRPDECFELMKFLCGPVGAKMQSHLGLAIPPLQSVANSPDFLSPSGIPRHHAQIFLDAIKYAKLQQNPREAEWTRICNDTVTKAIQLGQVTTAEVAKEIKDLWLSELDSPLRRHEWGPMHWGSIWAIVVAGAFTFAILLWLKTRRERLGHLDKAHERAGFAFIMPWLIGFVALTLGPMLVSLVLSFTKWSAMIPMSDAQSVGLANYHQLVAADPTFLQSLKVTLYFVILAVPIGQIASLAVALLMNNKLRGITVFRTVYFVPSVISGVAISVLWLQIFNNEYGILNTMLRPVLGIFHTQPPDWFGRDAHTWAIPAFVIMGLWVVGSGMIIYLAGLKGIPASMYEAATIDGAGALRRFWNVTLPMLSPLIFYNLVMAIIGSFQVFTQAMVMTGGGPNNATLFYVLNLYRQAFEFHNMGYASAMAWVLFTIILILTIAIFRGSKNLVYYEGLKS